MDPRAQLIDDLRIAERALDVGDSGLGEYRHLAAHALQARFACSMASLWRLGGEPGRRTLRCMVALSDEPQVIATGVELAEADIRAYIEALARDGVYNCSDVLTDPHLIGMLESYLRPQRVRGLLDACFQVNGRLMGVLCLEQRDVPRHWTRMDELDLRKAASSISLAMSRQLFGADRSLA